MSSKRRSKRLAIAALALLLALVVLAAFEVTARVRLGPDFVYGAFVGPPQRICGEFDPDLGWRNRANTSVRIAGEGFTYHVTINSRGQRGPERGYDKPAGVKRVVLLGDSTAWGWGVDDGEMWPRLVERALGGTVEIINLAVPGYSTDQESWVLEAEGLKYHPDLVLLAFVHNDTWSNNVGLMQDMAKPYYALDEKGAWVLHGQPVAAPKSGEILTRDYLRRTLSMYCASLKLGEPPPPKPAPPYNLADPKVVAGIERLWNDLTNADKPTHMLLGRLRETAAKAGASMLAFVFPHLVDRYLYNPSMPVPAHAATQPFETYGTRKLAEAGSELGFETFSVDQALLDVVSTGVSLDCGDEHLNARGNAVVADVIVARLRAWLARNKS